MKPVHLFYLFVTALSIGMLFGVWQGSYYAGVTFGWFLVFLIILAESCVQAFKIRTHL